MQTGEQWESDVLFLSGAVLLKEKLFSEESVFCSSGTVTSNQNTLPESSVFPLLLKGMWRALRRVDSGMRGGFSLLTVNRTKVI